MITPELIDAIIAERQREATADQQRRLARATMAPQAVRPRSGLWRNFRTFLLGAVDPAGVRSSY